MSEDLLGSGAIAPGLPLVRIWSDAASESHIQRLTAPTEARSLPILRARITPERAVAPRWHPAPARLFAINLAGDLDCETSDGDRVYIPTGGVAFLEDTSGKGHMTTTRRPVTLLFLYPPDDFDIAAWCAGQRYPQAR